MINTKQEIHVGDVGTAFRCTVRDHGQTVDLEGATTKQLLFAKPSGETLTKTATLYNANTLQYVTVDGDLDEAGTWTVQGELVFSNGTWHTDTHTFTVYENVV